MENTHTRERVLEIAARQIRKAGLNTLIAEDLAREAGVAQNEFAAEFPSSAALTAAAADQALLDGDLWIDERIGLGKDPTVGEIVDAYLDPAHVGDAENGCAVCALAGEARYARPEIQAVITRHLRDNAALLAQAAGGNPAAHRWALGAMSAIVGAVTLARAVNDPALAQSILEETRKLIAPHSSSEEIAGRGS